VTRRLLTIGLLLAILGYGSFFVFFHQEAGATRWHQRFGRKAAIEIAQRLATSRGIDVRGWSVSAASENDATLERYLRDRNQASRIEYLTAVRSTVIFRGPLAGDTFSVRLNAEGTPTAFLIRKRKMGTQPAAAAEANAVTARVAFEKSLGLPLPPQPPSITENGADRTAFRWARKSQSFPGLTFTTLCVLKAGTPVEVRADYELDPGYVRDHMAAPTGIFLPVAVSLVILLVLTAAGFSIAAAVRRQIPVRPALGVVVVIATVLLLAALANASNDMGQSFEEPDSGTLARVGPIVGSCFLAMFVAAVWAGGNRFSYRQFPESASRLDRLLRGDVLSRNVLSSIAFGLMAAGVPAAIPYVLAAAHVGGGGLVAGLPADPLFEPWASIRGREWFRILLTFGFAIPLITDKISHKALARVIGFGLGLVLFTRSDNTPRSLYVVLAVVLFVFYDQLFRRVDIVAALSAGIASSVIVNAAVCIAQPARAIYGSGSLMIIALILTTGSAVVGSFTRRENEDLALEEWAPLSTTHVGERQRLQVEFDVARQVQERMLPAAPPVIPGFSVASICRPARQVGGDLYDFLPIAEGEWAIAVADVSGKGLPAALYMAMTKGLLLAASDGRVDPAAILSDVNRGLHAVGQRNVFVTAFFGVLEPAGRTLRFVSAGHYATLWRRPAINETVSLMPLGIALGMTGSVLFDRSLETEEMTFAAGDALFIYSDGVVEAMDASAEEYGDERLLAAVAKTDGLDANAARDLIVRDVAGFVGKAPAHDDLTLVVIRALEIEAQSLTP
jgi:hypothetical protein